MEESKKRSAPTTGDGPAEKKSKTKKQWQTPKRGFAPQHSTIEAGDVGIWATCEKGKEAKCVGELKDLFQEYAEKLYGDAISGKGSGAKKEGDGEELDIEAEINQEVENMQRPTEQPLFTNVRIDVQCVLFFKTRHPIEPVSFVTAICADALATGKRRSRFAQRLTPMTLMGKATESGLETVAKEVLAPHFQGEGNAGKKFAIRPTIRNHSKGLKRDAVIKQVASLVGPSHKVDLSNPDLSIVVEVYTNICGMSVVGPDWDKLKRFNLAEIYQPSQKGEPSAGAAEAQKREPSTGRAEASTPAAAVESVKEEAIKTE